MKLGGYHRLWLVLSFLYLLVVITFLALQWPNLKDIPHNRGVYESLPLSVKDIMINTPLNDEMGFVPEKSQPVKMPNDYIIYFKPNTATEKMQQASKAYWNQIEKESLQQKIKFSIFGLLFWLIPCLMIYILGFLIYWIIQGFKKQTA